MTANESNVHQNGRDPARCEDDLSGAGRNLRGVPPGAMPLDSPADLVAAVESLLFVADEPVEAAVLASALNAGTAAIEAAIDDLAERCRERGVRVQRAGERVQLISAPELGPYVERFLGAAAEQRLSGAALETLAIVAYRQPVTRGTIEAIRGVNSERALSTLRSRDLVEEVGRAETVGHPVLFGTTMRFLEYFGLEQPGELPPLHPSPTPLAKNRPFPPRGGIGGIGGLAGDANPEAPDE